AASPPRRARGAGPRSSRRARRDEREANFDLRALLRAAAHGDVAVVLADDAVDDGQSEAGAHGLAGLEGLEHPPLLLASHPPPVVAAGEDQGVPLHADADLQG